MNILLAPDVYVNASVALGSPPDKVVQRVLGKHKGETQVSEWVLARVHSMLSALPSFKPDAVEAQLQLIRSLVQVQKDGTEFGPGEWERALVDAAKRASVTRVVTDHPDLIGKERSDGIDFMPTEAFLLELMTPPPPPV
jgi:hypothetical protein